MDNSKDNPMWGVLNTLDLAPTNDNPNIINAGNNPQISINNNLLTSSSVMLNMAEISNEVSALMDDSGWAMQAPTPLPTSPDLNNDAASRLSFSDFFSSADDLLNDCNVLFTVNSANNCDELTPKNFPNPAPPPIDYAPKILTNQCQTTSKQQQQPVTIINISSAPPPSEDRSNNKKNTTRIVFSDISKMDQAPSTSAAVRIDHQTYCSLPPVEMKGKKTESAFTQKTVQTSSNKIFHQDVEKSENNGQNIGEFVCEQCSLSYSCRFTLRRHVLMRHPGSITPAPLPKCCPFPGCTYVTRNQSLMQNHKRSHLNASLYFCKQCKNKYKTRPALLQHLTSKHDSNTALIGMVFANLPPSIAAKLQNDDDDDDNVIDDDENSRDNNDAASCRPGKVAENGARCEKDSSKLDSLVDEVVSNCRNPNINETSTINNNNNNSTNQNSTTFACGFCPFSSVNFSDVYRHKLTMHLNNGENSGNVPSFSETPNNIQHNDNICLYCFKKFASSNNLLAHIKKQHLQAAKTSRASRKTYSCSKCSFTTTRKKVLKAHEDYIRHPDDQNHRSTEADNRVHNRTYYANNNMINNDRAPDFSNSTFFGRHSSTKQQQQQILVQKRPVVNNNKQMTATVNNGFTPQSSLVGGLNGKDSGCYDSSWNETYDLAANRAAPAVNGRFESANLARTDDDRLPPPPPSTSTSSSTFESMAACVEHLQMANGSLLRLCRRRENELKSLRANVLELLKRVYHRDGGGAVVTLANHTLEDVDGLVIDAINSTLLNNGTSNNNNNNH